MLTKLRQVSYIIHTFGEKTGNIPAENFKLPQVQVVNISKHNQRRHSYFPFFLSQMLKIFSQMLNPSTNNLLNAPDVFVHLLSARY